MNLLKIRIIQIAPLLFWGVNVVGQSIDNHFLFNQFRDATILYKNKKENRTALNYNKATEEMIYISPEGKNMALYPIDQIDTVYFDKRKFVPVDNRFYEVLSRNKYTLYASYRCRMSIQAQNIGYGTSSTTAVDNISSLNTSGEIYQLKKFTKAKELVKLFPDLKKEIALFIKKNRIKNNTESIVKIVDFISGL